MNFDKEWFKTKSRVILVFILPVSLVLFALALTVFNLRDKSEVIMPPDNKGFVGKANELLHILLTDSNYIDSSVRRIRSIDDLNRKYRALEFAIPYGSDALAMREDIRLVKIVDNLIVDPNLRNFYFNSNLPSLLSKQEKNLGDKMFKIRTSRDNSGIQVKSIEIIRSMFKVSLCKDPWTGNIYSENSSLFEQCPCIFLTYENTTIPLRVLTQVPSDDHYSTMNIDISRHSVDYNGGEIDYYHYYHNVLRENRFNRFVIRGGQLPNRTSEVFIKCTCTSRNAEGSGDSILQIRLNNGLSCSIYRNGGDREDVLPSNHEAAPRANVKFSDGMRIVLRRMSNREVLAEMTLTKNNPMLLLSSLVKSNSGSKRSFAEQQTDMFTQQVVRGLSSNLSNRMYPDNVKITIDPLLSKEFERELGNYLAELKERIRTQPGQRWDISLTVLDIATGNIIATPFVSDESEKVSEKVMLTRKNPALERRYVGSVFKPMLTLATVQTNPSLLRLNTTGKLSAIEIGQKGCETGIFLGATTKGWAPASHWNGCDMVNYLAHSDDVYPVALSALCLNHYNDNRDLNIVTDIRPNFGNDSFFERQMGRGIEIGDRSVSGFEMFSILDALYNINSYDEYDADTMQMENYMWRNMNFVDRDYFGLSEVIPEPTVMQYDFMTGHGHTLRGDLVPWVLGQGNNYWNCIKLAEAWGRMLGKRAISASFVANKDNVDSIPPSLVHLLNEVKLRYNERWGENRINTTWNGFLNVFRNAQSLSIGSSSTLLPMYNRITTLNNRLGYTQNDRHRLVLFSKTGTPNEYSYIPASIDGRRSYIDLGIYCMGIMTEESFRRVINNQPASGIICVIRVTRQYPRSTENSGLWSHHARDFFTDNRLEKLYFMTKKFMN